MEENERKKPFILTVQYGTEDNYSERHKHIFGDEKECKASFNEIVSQLRKGEEEELKTECVYEVYDVLTKETVFATHSFYLLLEWLSDKVTDSDSGNKVRKVAIIDKKRMRDITNATLFTCDHIRLLGIGN